MTPTASENDGKRSINRRSRDLSLLWPWAKRAMLGIFWRRSAPPNLPSILCSFERKVKIKLTVEEPAKKPRGGYPRWQRDGLIFEAISWLAARQVYPGVLLKTPHVSATSQGLDGLMIELKADKSGISRTTIFEDKCTDDARDTFLSKVVPEFKRRHNNERSAEIISTAIALIMTAGVDEVTATQFAAAVTDQTLRRYRASFAVTVDSQAERKKLFADYNRVEKLQSDQRIGASFVVPPKMRDWLTQLRHRPSAISIPSTEANRNV